jgi:hypothetical protein
MALLPQLMAQPSARRLRRKRKRQLKIVAVVGIVAALLLAWRVLAQ